MEYPISDSSEMFSLPSQSQNSLPYNINFKTVFLFIILIIACCLLSIGYDFKIDLNSGISVTASIILILFLFYVLYEFFKSDTCEDLNKTGVERLLSSAKKGFDYTGKQGTKGIISMGKLMNTASNRFTNPSPIQPSLQQYQNQQYLQQPMQLSMQPPMQPPIPQQIPMQPPMQLSIPQQILQQPMQQPM